MIKKALIAGITGQYGVYLACLLNDQGYTVVGTSRDAQVAHFQGLVRS
jgi:GDPmannose 4,6-dehydratase